jgi:6-phosphogluconate dehydrogenase (decarboxylating)
MMRLGIAQDYGGFADKMLSALRYQFGGHEEKAAAKKVAS